MPLRFLFPALALLCSTAAAADWPEILGPRRRSTDPAAYASPVIFSGPQMRGVAAFNSSGLVGINPRDGTEIFRQPWKTDYDVNAATSMHKDGKSFLGTGYDRGIALVDARSLADRALENRGAFSSPAARGLPCTIRRFAASHRPGLPRPHGLRLRR